MAFERPTGLPTTLTCCPFDSGSLVIAAPEFQLR
jgi:hypothetical protein